MKHKRTAFVLPLIAALAVGGLVGEASLSKASAANAPRPEVSEHSVDLSARSRRVYRRHHGNAAAAAMFGIVAGTIAQVAINESRRSRYRYYDGYGYYGGYGYAPVYRSYYYGAPAYYGYGYAPHYRVHRHHRYTTEGIPHVRRW